MSPKIRGEENMTSFQKEYRELTDRLMRHVGWTSGISATADTLLRQARRYATIQERWCSEEMSDEQTAALEARESRLEQKITDTAWDLPHHDSGPWAVRFTGDPRGYTVTLVAPDGTTVGVS